MRIAIAIETNGNMVEDVQVFKTFDAACKSVEDNDHNWDGEPYDHPGAERTRMYPTVEGEWHVQEIEVPE